MANEIISILNRDLVTLEDETNPEGSGINTIYPSTTLDQVFDQKSSTNKTLRTIIDELKVDILTGARGNIQFPVTSVNGQTGNVTITAQMLGLTNIDNTADIDKPLSDPQRQAVNEMLASYKFHVDMTDLYNHITDNNNPHGVTIQQLNNNGSVTTMINDHIRYHNLSSDENTHPDIRSKITELSNKIDATNISVEHSLANALDTLARHDVDEAAHVEMFASKEDASNKVSEIYDGDHKTYPTTRAVVEYVGTRLAQFKSEMPDMQQWIDDIIFIDSRSNLPPATYGTFRKAYYIRVGIGNNPEVAICRLNPDGRTYGWDISPMNTISKFDPEYFIETADGLSLKVDSITGRVMERDAIIEGMKSQLENIMPNVLGEYYTKTAIDTFHFIRSIRLIPGTQDGTIRYFINDDEQTMSEDIRIAGLQRLAFLEWVTEGELADQSVHSRHILDRAIENRHMADKAVTYKNLQATHMTMFGNLEDDKGRSVQEITMPELATTLYPYLDLKLDDYRFNVMTDKAILDILYKAFRKTHGWFDPNLAVNVYISHTGDLIIEYDNEDPDVWIDDNALYMSWNNTTTDNALIRLRFRIEDNDLIVDYDEIDPDKPAEFKIDGDDLIVEYHEKYMEPQFIHDDEGNIILISYDSEADLELAKYGFLTSTNHNLIMTYDMQTTFDQPSYLDIADGDLILTYDEAYGQPEIWLDRTTGDLVLNSYGTENDLELAKYIFKINLAGELEAIYLG